MPSTCVYYNYNCSACTGHQLCTIFYIQSRFPQVQSGTDESFTILHVYVCTLHRKKLSVFYLHQFFKNYNCRPGGQFT